MKRSRLLLVLVVCVMMALLMVGCRNRSTGSDGDDWYLNKAPSEGLNFDSNGDGTCMLIDMGDCTDTALIIPSVSPDGDRVTEIGDANGVPFDLAVEKIFIPETVISVSMVDMSSQGSLGKIAVHKDNPVYYSENNCLIEKETQSLILACKNSKIPDQVKEIASRAFYACELDVLEIPKSVLNIEEAALNGCHIASEIKVDKENPNYYSEGNCLIEKSTGKLILGSNNSTIPDGVKIIGRDALAGYEGITEIVVPASVVTIEDNAFHSCINLKNVSIPDSVNSIGVNILRKTAFYQNEQNWQDGILYVGNHLISTKEELSGILTVRKGTRTIAAYAIVDWESITGVIIPDSVTNIGRDVFWNAKGLTSIVVDEKNPVYYSEGNCLIEKESGILLRGCNTSVIPDGVMCIDNAFRGCTELKSVVIPDSVTSMEGAFYGCTSLTDVTIGKNVKNIGDGAFRGCTSLANVHIPDGVGGIGNGAFYNCESLTNITIPGSVVTIGWEAFSGCTSLKNVIISEGVKNAGECAFWGCALENIFIPKSLTNIAGDTLMGCAFVGNPDTLTSIIVDEGNPVYYSEGNCLIERETKTLLLGCNTSVIPKDVASIGVNAFYHLNMTNITIPAGVHSISCGAFWACRNLTDINYSGTMEEWKTVSLDKSWIYGIPATVVHCTDGDVPIEKENNSGDSNEKNNKK